MSFSLTDHVTIEIIIISLSGILVYILTPHYFAKGRQLLIFLTSFVMGIFGSDTALTLINYFIPILPMTVYRSFH